MVDQNLNKREKNAEWKSSLKTMENIGVVAAILKTMGGRKPKPQQRDSDVGLTTTTHVVSLDVPPCQ